MHSITPAYAMARRARRLLTTGAIVVLAGLVILALGVLSVVIPLARAGWYSTVQTILFITGFGVAGVGVVLAVRGVTLPSDNVSARIMGDILARGLDYRYTFIRNIARRGLGYVDALLVGPNGVLVFYFFEHKGVYHVEGNVWFKQKNRQFVLDRPNPIREVVNDVNAVREYLVARRLDHVPVYAVVAIRSRECVVTAQNPVLPVGHMPDVLPLLQDNYLAAERIPPHMVRATVDALMAGSN